MDRQFFISNFGCRASQSEGASIYEELIESGAAESESADSASVVIVNSCTVTEEADRQVRQQIRRVARRNPKAPNLRQIHLIPSELFDALQTSGFEVRLGDLGENIATVGLDLECLTLGTLLRLGASATLELTGLRTPCVLIDRFRSGLKNRLQGKPAGPRFKAGVMAIVTEGGEVSPGDRIRAVLPAPPHLDLPPL